MNIGIDLGGTKTLIGQFKDDKLIEKIKLKTLPNYDEFIESIRAELLEISTNPEMIGIAVAGRLDEDRSTFIAGGNLTWHNKHVVNDLQKFFPKSSIKMENDANVAALYEANRGNGKNFKKMVYITLSTGIGIGVTQNGKLDPELLDAEVGQLLITTADGNRSWESIASGKAFYEKYGVLAAECKDAEIWKSYSLDLLPGFSDIIATITPDVIVVGGSMDVALDKFEPHLTTELKKYFAEKNMAEVCPIVSAKSPQDVVLLGTQLL